MNHHPSDNREKRSGPFSLRARVKGRQSLGPGPRAIYEDAEKLGKVKLASASPHNATPPDWGMEVGVAVAWPRAGAFACSDAIPLARLYCYPGPVRPPLTKSHQFKASPTACPSVARRLHHSGPRTEHAALHLGPRQWQALPFSKGPRVPMSVWRRTGLMPAARDPRSAQRSDR